MKGGKGYILKIPAGVVFMQGFNKIIPVSIVINRLGYLF
jgi:hypothetical protein